MKFLEALYGSQYYELVNSNRDGNAGRLNGNLFLSAFVIVCFFLTTIILSTFSEAFSKAGNHVFHQLFGYSSGKEIGKLLAIPLMGLIYFVISKTAGSVKSYEKRIRSFLTYPEKEKQKANRKILLPFFIAVGLLFVFSMISLF